MTSQSRDATSNSAEGGAFLTGFDQIQEFYRVVLDDADMELAVTATERTPAIAPSLLAKPSRPRSPSASFAMARDAGASASSSGAGPT